MLDVELKETKSIIVETEDFNNHVFTMVEEDGQFYLQHEQYPMLINQIVLKPNMKVYFQDGSIEDGKRLLKSYLPDHSGVLATNFSIDPDIFKKLITYRLISYSKTMAELYQLPIEHSNDISYHTRDYKRSKNQEKILSKLREGNFNN